MRINSIKLENFAGIKKAEFELNGKDSLIKGANATGKTTIFNAFVYLLTDKNSTLESNWTPKTTATDGEDKHHLDHTVEAVLESDGVKTTLKKVYHEIYKKKRGTNIEEFSGHTTDHFIDSVPVKKAQYEEKVLELTGVDTLEGILPLIIGNYFALHMSWQDRRAILLDMVGDISQADILNAEKELKELVPYLNKDEAGTQQYTVEEIQAINKAQRKELQKQLESIPARIDEAEKAKPELTKSSIRDLETAVKVKETAIKEIDKEIKEASVSQGETEKVKKLAELRNKLSEKQAELNKDFLDKSTLHRVGKEAVTVEVEKAERELRKAKLNLEEQQLNLTSTSKKREELAEQFTEVSKLQWNDAEGICQTCKRPLEAEQIEQAKANFNQVKSERLSAINLEGQSYSKDVITGIEAEIEAEKTKIEEIKKRLAKAEADLANYEKNNPAPSQDDYLNNPDYLALRDSIKELVEQEAEAVDTTELVKKRASLENEVASLKEEIAKFAVVEQQDRRIKELEEEEKLINSKCLETEKVRDLCELYIRTRVSLLDSKVNSHFTNVKFQLFQDQINGGIKEVCEVLITSEQDSDVPYSKANTGAKILADVEIISTLQEHYKAKLPLFVDNTESLTEELPEHEMQIIMLRAEPNIKTLEIEEI